MKKSSISMIAGAVLVIVLLLGTGTLLENIALLGEAGRQAEAMLNFHLLQVGQLSVTALFLIKVTLFLLALASLSRFLMGFMQHRVLTHTAMDEGQQFVMARLFTYVVFGLGLVIGVQSIGVDLSSLVVVGGALGLGVGLAMQELLSNFVAGIVLLFEQPIRLGDRIQVGDTYGDIVQLHGRSTWIRTNDNVVIIVPNSEFINKRVTNWTANDRQVRISMPVGVSYGSDPEKVRKILMQVAGEHKDVVPESEVIFLGFGDSALNFQLRIWTITQVQTPNRLKSDLYFNIFKAFRAEGIEIPFPQRDLHVRSVDEKVHAMLAGQA